MIAVRTLLLMAIVTLDVHGFHYTLLKSLPQRKHASQGTHARHVPRKWTHPSCGQPSSRALRASQQGPRMVLTAWDPARYEPLLKNEADTLQIRRLSTQHSPAAGQIHDHHEKSNQPLFLWLPGLDGTAVSASAQFCDLSRKFELRIFGFTKDDRNSFQALTNFCIEYLESFKRESVADGNKFEGAIIGGESFGGLLALSIGLERPDLVQVANNPLLL